jgi:hypothetical protein
MFAFAMCCCCRGLCQWPFCGAATFIPKAGVWEIDEETWVEKFISAKEQGSRKASEIADSVKEKVKTWDSGEI